MSRFVTALVVVAAGTLWWATPILAAPPEVPRDPCTVLTRAQVRRLLIGKRVVHVKRRHNAQNRAVECTWVTGYFQTASFRRADDALSLQVTLQPTATAMAALDELRARIRNPTNETTSTIPNLGDEAYLHFGDVIVVSGPLVVQAGLSNYDTSAQPYPAADDLARQAASLALRQLATLAAPPASVPASSRARLGSDRPVARPG